MAVAVQSSRIRMSQAEFEQLLPAPPFYDYIDGEAVEVNRPTVRHRDVVVCLAYTLRQYARLQGLGLVVADANVKLPAGDWVGHDVTYLAPDRAELYHEEKGAIIGAPSLVIEVLSPSTAMYDRTEKLAMYEAAQVRYVWLIDQESLAVDEFQWTPDGYLRVGAVPGGQPFTPKAISWLTLNIADILG